MDSLPKTIKFSDQNDRFKEMSKEALLDLFGSMIKLDVAQQVELVSLGKNHGAIDVAAYGADWSLIGWRFKSYADDTSDFVLYALNLKTKQVKFISKELGIDLTMSYEQAVDYAAQEFGYGGDQLFAVLSVISPETFTIEVGDQAQPTVFTENMRIWSVGGNHIGFIGDKPVSYKEDHMLLRLYHTDYCVGINTETRHFELIHLSDQYYQAQYVQR